ncbi:MAG: DMT family transporter [Pseudomonadota bacterium]
MTDRAGDYHPTDNLKAIALMAFSMVMFAVDDAAIKFAGNLPGGSVTPGEILIIKGVLGTLVYGTLMLREGTQPTFGLWRGIILDRVLAIRTVGDLLSALAIITGLTLLPLSTMSAVLQVQPLVVTMGAALFLKEAVGWRRWSAVLVGFIGVMIIIQPGGATFDSAIIWALLAVLGLAVRDLATRQVKARFSTFSIVTFVAFLLIPLGISVHTIMDGTPLFVGISPAAWVVIIVGGFFGMGGYYAITVSMRIGELSAVAPYRYVRLVAALILAFFIFGEVPNLAMILGATLVIGAGLFTLYRERKLQSE